MSASHEQFWSELVSHLTNDQVQTIRRITHGYHREITRTGSGGYDIRMVCGDYASVYILAFDFLPEGNVIELYGPEKVIAVDPSDINQHLSLNYRIGTDDFVEKRIYVDRGDIVRQMPLLSGRILFGEFGYNHKGNPLENHTTVDDRRICLQVTDLRTTDDGKVVMATMHPTGPYGHIMCTLMGSDTPPRLPRLLVGQDPFNKTLRIHKLITIDLIAAL